MNTNVKVRYNSSCHNDNNKSNIDHTEKYQNINIKKILILEKKIIATTVKSAMESINAIK